jgi:hypothetical protein
MTTSQEMDDQFDGDEIRRRLKDLEDKVNAYEQGGFDIFRQFGYVQFGLNLPRLDSAGMSIQSDASPGRNGVFFLQNFVPIPIDVQNRGVLAGHVTDTETVIQLYAQRGTQPSTVTKLAALTAIAVDSGVEYIRVAPALHLDPQSGTLDAYADGMVWYDGDTDQFLGRADGVTINLGGAGGFYNVKSFGALGDNSNDDTAEIQAAIDAANSAGGGIVFFPEGTYISGTLTIFSNIHILGAGMGTSVIKFKDNTNDALLFGYNYYNLIQNSGTANAAVTTTNTTLTDTRLAMTVDAFIGETVTCNGKTLVVTANTATTFTGTAWSGGSNPGNGNAWSTSGDTTGGIRDFSIQAISLNGNKANNATTGYGLQVYGYRYILRDVDFYDWKTNEILTEWSTASSENMEARVDNCRFRHSTDSSDGGIVWKGPHDSKFSGCHFFYGGGKSFDAPHASKSSGLVFTGCHSYGVNHTYCWYLEGSGCALHGCIADHATTAQIYIGNNDFIIDGCLVAGAGATEIGIDIEGSSGASGYHINANVVNCDSGAIRFGASAAGGGIVNLNVYQESGAAVSGTIPSTVDYQILVSGGATGGGMGSTNSWTTDLTLDSAKSLVIGDVSLFRAATGIVQTNQQMIAADGFRMKTKAGIPTDSDTTVDADGVIILDTSNHRLYIRSGGAWKYAALT